MTTATQRHRIETFSGLFVDYDDPQPEQISIYDIAHALSQICRFGGHTRVFYSVAEHSILVSRLLGKDRSLPRLAALLHDAHEAYLGDIPTPLKNALGPEYRVMVDRLDRAIVAAVGLRPDEFHDPAVVWADAVALRLEAHKLKHSRGEHPEWDVAWEAHSLKDVALLVPTLNFGDIEGWQAGLSPREAEDAFLENFFRLIEERC
jgi:hypothetical protein